MTANSNGDLLQNTTGVEQNEGRRKRKRSSSLSSPTNNNINNKSNANNKRINVIPNIDTLSSERMMNLRNRPLKAATAGVDSPGNPGTTANQNISKSPATTISSPTTSLNNKNTDNHSVTRRSKRNNQQQSPSTSIGDSLRQQDNLSTTSSLPASSTRSIRSFFPLRTIGAVCELFRSQLNPQNQSSTVREDGHFEPDLALLSIVIGIVEASLTRAWDEEYVSKFISDIATTTPADSTTTTTNSKDMIKKEIHSSNPPTTAINTTRSISEAGSYSPAEATPAPIVAVRNGIHSPLDIPIPTVFYENVESLLKKFTTHIKELFDLSKYPKKTTRELMKKISEVIWSNLHRSHYKDRAHVQTIYNYITEKKLDCYGVAYTVLAACQILGLDDVRLVMSEDHTWVVFGEDETCEVTWHGKTGNDERYGQSIPENNNCWLYLNGNTMICDRYLSIATQVSGMNLSINATQDSEELAILQQQLLWVLYDYGYLEKYPMALGNLGDLEDVLGCNRKRPTELFFEAIESAKKYYNDYHVYPYTYFAGYYFRSGIFKEAIKFWANAAKIIRKYNYTRDDEEIYKEFQEIAIDLIPYTIKNFPNKTTSIVDDPECFANLLRFYDGLCAWEEDSSTPVLHIGWTKPIVSTISKFPYSTRSQVSIKVCNSNVKSGLNSENEDDEADNNVPRERRIRRAASISGTTTQVSTNNANTVSEKINDSNAKIKLEKIDETNILKDNQESINLKKKAKVLNNSQKFVHNNQMENDDDEYNSVILISKKFSGIKDLLTADKLNTSAIQLQLTAQSQVNINNKRKRIGGKLSDVESVASTTASTTTVTISSNTTTTNQTTSATNNLNRTNQNIHKRFRRETIH